MNYLASPPLVVAYALAGTTDINLATEALGTAADGSPVTLAELWPSPKEIADLSRTFLKDPVRIEVSPPGKAADKVLDMLLAKKRSSDRRSWLEEKGNLALIVQNR